MEGSYVIGIDLGGTKISGALADLNGKIISQHVMQTNASEGEEAVFNRIKEVINTVLNKSRKKINDIGAIGVGSPGPLDSPKGTIIDTPNLPFKNFSITKPLEDEYKTKAYLDNDANVAAIGEYMFGAGKGTKNMIYVTVSTGIGGGAILDGKIYRGNKGNALEIGHSTLEKDGPRCNCGNYGCIEALSSGTAIGRQAREAIEEGENTSLKCYHKITSYEVFTEAANGDRVAKGIIDKSLNYLGIFIANIINFFDPEMIIIGGGVSKAGPIVFDTIQNVVDKRCYRTMAENCRIVPAGLGTDAGVIGAVALALMENGKLANT